MGSHHQAWHAVSEENQSPAAPVWRLPAWDACQEEEGELYTVCVFSMDLVSNSVFIINPLHLTSFDLCIPKPKKNEVCPIKNLTTTAAVLELMFSSY